VVPVQNDELVYRLWLFDGKYKTSFGVVTYDNFWAKKILTDETFNPQELAILKVNKLSCYPLPQVNRWTRSFLMNY